MLKQRFIVSFFVLLALTGNAFPENKPAQSKPKEPIIITSETLSADNKAHTALFEGSVVAKTEDIIIYSDKMRVSYAEQTGNVQRVDAEGRVKLIKKDLVVTSKSAVYFADEEKIVFTGEPKATEKGNIVTGSEITYLIKEDRSIIKNSRVLLENKKGP